MSFRPHDIVRPTAEELLERVAQDVARAVLLLRPGQTLSVQCNHNGHSDTRPRYTLTVRG